MLPATAADIPRSWSEKTKTVLPSQRKTTAFPNLKFSIIAELQPGEIVRLTENGIEKRKSGDLAAGHPCAFLWIYTSFPATSIEGVNVEKARYNSGALLARRDKAAGFTADIVAGVPDSGVGHAIGYANESGIPYARPIVKYTPSWPRSYMPSEQSTRDLIADMKLIAIPELIEGKRIVICDDSIVRGTQLSKMIEEKLMAHGAREVHLRIACPPLMFPCIYNQSTRTTGELAARKAIRSIEGRRHPGCRGVPGPEFPKIPEDGERGRARIECQFADVSAAGGHGIGDRSPGRQDLHVLLDWKGGIEQLSVIMCHAWLCRAAALMNLARPFKAGNIAGDQHPSRAATVEIKRRCPRRTTHAQPGAGLERPAYIQNGRGSGLCPVNPAMHIEKQRTSCGIEYCKGKSGGTLKHRTRLG